MKKYIASFEKEYIEKKIPYSYSSCIAQLKSSISFQLIIVLSHPRMLT